MHDLRKQLISEGLIRPAGTFEPPRYEHPEPVLRLDEAGRNAVHRPYDEDQNREVAEAIARMRGERVTEEPEPEPEYFAFGSADGTIPGTPLGSAYGAIPGTPIGSAPLASAAQVVLARGSADGAVAAVGRRGSADGTSPPTGVRHSASEVNQ